MTSQLVDIPFPTFTDVAGQPLNAGYVWVGTANQNPITNPVTVYWDASLTQPADQPIRTIAGRPTRAGSPARIYLSDAAHYSVLVQDMNGVFQYSELNRETVENKMVDLGINLRAELASKASATVGAGMSGFDQTLAYAKNTVGGAIASTVIATIFPFLAVADGVTDDTAAVTAAYLHAKTIGGELYLPAGTYLGKFVFNGEAPVRGAGPRRTILKPSDTASYCVRLYGAGGDANLGANLSKLSIVSTAGTGTGLLCGDSAGSGFSNGLVERIEISGFADNLLLNSAIMCTFRAIWSHDGTFGLRTDTENNITTCHFDTCRFTTNDYGIKLEAGTVLTFTNCNSESSVYKNLWLYTSITQGPTRVIFNGCWFEDLTAGAGTRYSVHLDMQAAIMATRPMGIEFNRCVVTSPAGLPNVHADAAQDVVFNRCAFSAEYNAARFTWAAGNNSVRVKLIDCGTIALAPTSTMYASFPALTRASGGVFGFFYEFTQVNGKRFTNYEVLTSSVSVTSLQIAYAKTLVFDTTAGSLDINSLVGGSDGQVLHILKTSSANSLVIKHNGAGTEKIFTATAGDVTLTGREGATLVCYGSTWYEPQYI